MTLEQFILSITFREWLLILALFTSFMFMTVITIKFKQLVNSREELLTRHDNQVVEFAERTLDSIVLHESFVHNNLFYEVTLSNRGVKNPFQ